MAVAAEKVFTIVFKRGSEGLEYLALTPAFEPNRNTKPYVVTGSIESGETSAAAAKREVSEEIGLVPVGVIDLHTVLCYTDSVTKVHVLEHCFGVEVSDGDITLNEEHVGFRWLQAKRFVASIWWEGDRSRLQRFIKAIEAGV